MPNESELPFLNLTPKRGPSWWARADRAHTLGPQGLALVVAGAGLMASAMRRTSAARVGMTTLGVTCIVAGVFCELWMHGVGRWFANMARPSIRQADTIVDRAVEGSFPASDAPSSMQIA